MGLLQHMPMRGQCLPAHVFSCMHPCACTSIRLNWNTSAAPNLKSLWMYAPSTVCVQGHVATKVPNREPCLAAAASQLTGIGLPAQGITEHFPCG